MECLTYASTAVHRFSEADLLALLATARTFNARLEITGLLLYSPGTDGYAGTFVQALEGNKDVLQAVFSRIEKDPRHRDVTVIRREAVFSRRFPDWTMGFRDLSTLKPADVPGFNPIFFQGWTLKRVLAEPDPVLQALYSFAGS